MNIVVLLRAGRDPASFTVNRKAQKIFVHRDEYRTTPADLNALEAALQLGDAGQSVTAIALGGGGAEEALYQARAMGAARALWVKDAALADADAGPIAAIVQRAIAYLGGAVLVLLGAEVRHADLAQVGPRLGAALGWALVENAHAVQMADEVLNVTVPAGQAYHAVQVGTPCVVMVALDANQPRFAPAANIIRAYADAGAVEAVSAADLGLDAAAPKPQITRRGERYSPERTLGQVLEGSAEAVARQLAAALRA